MIGKTSPMAEALKHAVLIIGALIVILPFYAMVSYSLKSPHEIDNDPSAGVMNRLEVVRGRLSGLSRPP